MFYLVFRGRLDPNTPDSQPDFGETLERGPYRRVVVAETVITGDLEEGPQATWNEWPATGVEGWTPVGGWAKAEPESESVWFSVEVIHREDAP